MDIYDLTQDDGKILNNILSLMEYAYRIGVYHGAITKDPAVIDEVLNIPLDGKQFLVIHDAPKKIIPLKKFCDIVVMWCGAVSAMYLRNFLRSDSRIYSFRIAILISAFIYYREGLQIGKNYDRVDAKAFLDTVYRGMVHINAKTHKKRTKAVFFDEMKFKINNVYEEMKDNGVSSSLNRLSTFMGNTWVKYMAV